MVLEGNELLLDISAEFVVVRMGDECLLTADVLTGAEDTANAAALACSEVWTGA